MRICVKTAVMPKNKTWASPMKVDFSEDLLPGERVLGAMAGLSYFRLYYADNGSTSEAVGQASVTLVPNLTEDAVHVTASLVMTNYNGADAACSTDGSGHDSFVRITVVAVLGLMNPAYQAVAGNLYGLSGQWGEAIPIASASAEARAFLAGFYIAGSSAKEVSSLSFTSSVEKPGGAQAKVSGKAAQSGDEERTGTADVAFLSTDGVTSYRVLSIDTASSKWTEVDDERDGVTCAFSVTPTLNAGETVRRAGVLLQNVNINFERDKTSDLELFEAGVTSDTLSISNGKTISGTLILNIFNSRAGDDYGIAPPPTSNLTAFVIAEIARPLPGGES
ncbi:hypothetical protein D7Y21_30310 [Corallococcus sp. AB045]|uniref:hypothetical protein n=1 Tax=Corallococcus sp. AB045 TaxID=2316719 RepID=UPI000EE4DB9B|nr:hypothetical protein [Corallococcus sp. AB045]RKH81436.1 hypothetical protein D7Y21_30310 [Corallococcus sp. AB045]